MKKIEETRENIIEAAGRLFQKFGFEKTSMDEIAQLAHKAKRSLYYHFPGKEDLFEAVANNEVQKIKMELQLVCANKEQTALERLKTYLLRRTELISQSAAYIQLLQDNTRNGMMTRFPALSSITTQFSQWEYDQFSHWWGTAPNEKIAQLKPNAVAFADMLQMVLRGLDISFFVEGKYEEYRRTYTLLINLILDSILNYVLNDNQ